MKQIVAMLTVAVAGLFFGSLTARAADITANGTLYWKRRVAIGK